MGLGPHKLSSSGSEKDSAFKESACECQELSQINLSVGKSDIIVIFVEMMEIWQAQYTISTGSLDLKIWLKWPASFPTSTPKLPLRGSLLQVDTDFPGFSWTLSHVKFLCHWEALFSYSANISEALHAFLALEFCASLSLSCMVDALVIHHTWWLVVIALSSNLCPF